MNSWKGHFIGGRWVKSGEGPVLDAVSPVDGKPYWTGRGATARDVGSAISAASGAFPAWSGSSFEDRLEVLTRFRDAVNDRASDLAASISLATGKPLWESKTEAAAVAGKLGPTIEAYEQRAHTLTRSTPTATSVTRFLPHGVVAVIGPYNFPAHMANGHIMPALLAGNTVILKQSERVPAVAELIIDLWCSAGAPSGVINLLQGEAEPVQALARAPEVSALFFTGSRRAGMAISDIATPLNKILALEMGGNSPIVVWDCESREAAALIVVQSAYSSAGQRCSNARRLIVPSDDISLVQQLCHTIKSIAVGPPDADPAPFMGPLIDVEHVEALLETQQDLESRGGKILVPVHRLDYGSRYVSPGLIDVTAVQDRPDEEVFGPLLQLVRADTYQEALEEADRTAYGLAAGLVTDNPDLYTEFLRVVRAGIVNLNQPLTGASPLAPFGGVKASGNGRPSGYLAVDYCTYAVGSLESQTLSVPEKLPAGITLGDD